MLIVKVKVALQLAGARREQFQTHSLEQFLEGRRRFAGHTAADAHSTHMQHAGWGRRLQHTEHTGECTHARANARARVLVFQLSASAHTEALPGLQRQ